MLAHCRVPLRQPRESMNNMRALAPRRAVARARGEPRRERAGRRGVLGARRRLPGAAPAPAGAAPGLHHAVAQRRHTGRLGTFFIYNL